MEPTWMTLAFLHCILDINSVLDLRRTPLPPMSILLLLATFPGSGRVTSAQKLPSRDEEHFQYQMRHREVFYDTRLLPDGVERKVFLPQNETERYYFLVKEDGSPLSLTLTPCTFGTIEWKLLYQEYPNNNVGSATHPGAVDELFLQDERLSQKGGQRYIVVDTTLSGSRTTYTIGQTIPGLFTLQLKSSKKDASLQIYGTSSLESRPHPELPIDPKVGAVLNSDKTVTLSWKPSPSDVQHQQQVKYCVVVNHMKHYHSACAALALIKGDRLVLPPHVGFGFPWERKYKNITIESENEDATFECIGTKTSFMLDTVVSLGLRYYFDVFVVNTRTNTSTAYVGTTMMIKARNVKQLKEGKVRNAVVQHSNIKHFIFKLRKTTKELFLMVQPCTDPVFIQISRNGHVLNNSTISDHNNLMVSLKNARRGTYLLAISALGGNTRIKVSYSTRVHGVPYPTLPRDNQIYVVSNKTTCHSVTLSWLISDERQQHCIYAQKIVARHQLEHAEDQVQNTCVSKRHRKKKYKLKCVQFQPGHEQSHTETFTGLIQNSVYAINIYAAKHLHQWLSYKYVYVHTNAIC